MSMLDEGGKGLLVEVRVESANEALVKFYELFSDESKNASGDTELAIESVADYKEVTAIGVRADLERRQQRSSLRLSGPRGYEKSIQEDAVKMLEIAHQFVPRQSTVDMGEAGLLELPWDEAQVAMQEGGHLLKLGIDAIVGDELAQFWLTTDDIPMTAIRLSTRISIEPGSTRNLTQEQQAASLIELYQNVLFPTIYEPMQRYDLASAYLRHAAELMPGLDRIEDFLPTDDDVKQFQQQQQQSAQAEQEAAAQQADLEAAKGEQQMEIENQKAGNEQTKADIEIGKDVAKTRLEIARENFKQRMAERQAQITQKKSKEA